MAKRSQRKHKLKKGAVKSYTLTELEGEDWGEPPFPSHLVTECHRLRKVPIGDFTVENLRIMIGQNIGLDHLIPMTMQVLRRDPLASGDFFEGDLLQSVIRSEVADPRFRSEVHHRQALFEMRAQARMKKGPGGENFDRRSLR